jgi:hypothetical protein
VNDELEKGAFMLRRMLERQKAARRGARRFPNGKLRPKTSRNKTIAEKALVCELIPGGHGAEIWVGYTGMRESWLRLRQDERYMALMPNMMETSDPDALNGYVAYPKRHAPRLPHNEIGDIVQYIPVHGGVTYAHKDSFMAVWGFDTIHAGSEKQPRTDRDWIKANCWILYRGLMLAEKLWPEFRRGSQERRVKIADELLALIEEQPLIEKLGFEALISTLMGRV